VTATAAGLFVVDGGIGRLKYGLAQIDPVTGLPTGWLPDPDHLVHAVATLGDHVYIGGPFTTVGSATQSGFAEFSGAADPMTPPVATQDPQIVDGGGSLTCTRGSWTGSAPMLYAYSWRRDDAVVRAGPDYPLTPADGGHRLTCTVSARNDAGIAGARTSTLSVPAPGSPAVDPATPVGQSHTAPLAPTPATTTISTPTNRATHSAAPTLRILRTTTSRQSDEALVTVTLSSAGTLDVIATARTTRHARFTAARAHIRVTRPGTFIVRLKPNARARRELRRQRRLLVRARLTYIPAGAPAQHQTTSVTLGHKPARSQP
jgi:hypothetical protein